MKLIIKYYRGCFDVLIKQGKKEVFNQNFENIELLLNNEVLEDVLRNKRIELLVSNSLVLLFSDQYPLISRKEIKNFHFNKINKLLGFDSPPFSIKIQKKNRMIYINSFHLVRYIRTIVEKFKINVQNVNVYGINPRLKDYLLFDAHEVTLFIRGERCYTSLLDLSTSIIIKNLYKSLDDECFFSKVNFVILAKSEKAISIMNQLISRGDYEWEEA